GRRARLISRGVDLAALVLSPALGGLGLGRSSAVGTPFGARAARGLPSDLAAPARDGRRTRGARASRVRCGEARRLLRLRRATRRRIRTLQLIDELRELRTKLPKPSRCRLARARVAPA